MPKPVELSVRVDDKGVRVLQDTGKELDDVRRKSDRTTSRMQRGFERLKRGVGGLRSAVFGLKGAIAGLAIGLAAGAFTRLAQSLIRPSRMVETMTVGFKVLTGSLSTAKKRLAELTDFARTTPFELPQVFKAARVLRVFGIDTNQNLRLLGDAASAAQVPIEELAVWFGRLASGDYGEALMRFRELGVATKKDFEGKGLTFDKTGRLRATAAQAMNALGRTAKQKFGGMMEEQSRTLDGMISNFQDFVFQAKLKLGDGLFRVVKGSMERILPQLDALNQSGKLEQWGEKLAGVVGDAMVNIAKAVDWVRNVVLPKLASAWDWLAELPGKMKSYDWSGLGEDIGAALMRGMVRALTPGGVSTPDPRGGAGGAATLRAGFGRGGVRTDPTMDPHVTFDAKTGAATGERPADQIARGLDRSHLADDIRQMLSHAPPKPTPGQGDTGKGQRNLIQDTSVRAGFGGAVFNRPTGFGSTGIGGGGRGAAGSFGMGDAASIMGNTAVTDSTEALQAAVDAQRSVYEEMVQNALDNLGAVQQGWLDFRMGTMDIVGGWFEDLADASKSGAERFQDILDGMKRLALRTVWQMATGWLKARIQQATGEAAVQAALKATAATQVATAATETATAQVVTAAKSKEATAKAAASYGWVPFVGAAMLGAFVALLVSSLGKFETGGRVHGGSGTRDDHLALLTRDEGVVTQRGMQTIGDDGLAAINGGQMPGGGGGEMHVHLNLPGNAIVTRADMQAALKETVVPALEDLYLRRSLNVSGSRMQRK